MHCVAIFSNRSKVHHFNFSLFRSLDYLSNKNEKKKKMRGELPEIFVMSSSLLQRLPYVALLFLFISSSGGKYLLLFAFSPHSALARPRKPKIGYRDTEKDGDMR